MLKGDLSLQVLTTPPHIKKAINKMQSLTPLQPSRGWL